MPQDENSAPHEAGLGRRTFFRTLIPRIASEIRTVREVVQETFPELARFQIQQESASAQLAFQFVSLLVIKQEGDTATLHTMDLALRKSAYQPGKIIVLHREEGTPIYTVPAIREELAPYTIFEVRLADDPPSQTYFQKLLAPYEPQNCTEAMLDDTITVQVAQVVIPKDEADDDDPFFSFSQQYGEKALLLLDENI